MGAPTWPTDTPASERMSNQLSEDEVERAYLRDFLFGNPPRQLGTEDSGTALYELQRRLEAWLQSVLHSIGPHGVAREQCVDDFLLAFKPGEDVKGGKVQQNSSLFHFCQRIGLSQQTYIALWRDGCANPRHHGSPSCRVVYPRHQVHV